MIGRRTYLSVVASGAASALTPGTAATRAQEDDGDGGDDGDDDRTALPSLRAKVSPADGDSLDGFGGAVSLSGTTALVGAPTDEDPNGEKAGAAYVFERDEDGWRHGAKLVPEDGGPEDEFGWAVALAGDTALVSARKADPSGERNAGAAYVFERPGDGAGWTRRATLAPEDGDNGDFFGASVALDGDTALVGAPHDEDPNGDFSGAAYVFGRTGSGWGQRAKLAPDGGQPRENVGQSVALDGDTALVGTAPVEGTGANDPGGAYVFRRVDDGAGWRLRRTLAPDPSPEIRTLGAPVALAGDTALVGATVIENGTGSEDAVEAGGVYAYERTDDGWRRRARLPSADADRLPSPISSVALAGDAVVLGAGLEDTLNGRSTGAAHLFGRAGGAWTRRGALVAPDGDASDLFGAAVAADGSTVLVGTPGEEDPNGKLGGAVYAFERVAPAGAPPGPDVDDDGTPARDPNGDGRYEDVDGDGDVTADDVTVLFDATFERDAAVTDSVPLFDFNGDGSVRPGDATVLFEEVLGD